MNAKTKSATPPKAATAPKAGEKPSKPAPAPVKKAAVTKKASPSAAPAPTAPQQDSGKTSRSTTPAVKAAVAVKIAPADKPVQAKKPAAKTPTAKAPAVKPLPKATPAKTAPVVAETKAKPSVNVIASKPSAPAPAAAPSGVPVKSGRPSSRLAQLTVPSMAQSVASTAAKSSFNHTAQAPAAAPVIPAIVKKDAKLANNWKTTPVDRLTDAELLAMPDSEYMNDVQMAAFRLKLSTLKRDILNNAGETTEHLREDTSVVPDPADRATIEEEHALELRTRDRERKLLKKIEQSIARIDAGDYGYCDETGEAIGVGRLLARPTATLSLEAQQRRELKQKMFGD